MLHPSTVDGRSLVILRHRKPLIGSGFSVVANGQLEHDGDALYLVTNADARIVTNAELAGFQFVRPDSKIAECQGFDFFLIAE
jgi:hypothetical protein